MKKRRFSVEQIVGVLKGAEVGVPVTELIRKVGINDAGETRLNVAKLNSAYEPGKVRTERAKAGVDLRILANADNQKDRRACEHGDHGLRKNGLV